MNINSKLIYKGNNILTAIYKGNIKIYPIKLSEERKTEYSEWSYTILTSVGFRQRSKEVYKRDVYSNNTFGEWVKIIEESSNENEPGTRQQGDYIYDWVGTNTSTRYYIISYTFSDATKTINSASETGGTIYTVPFPSKIILNASGTDLITIRFEYHKYWDDIGILASPANTTDITYTNSNTNFIVTKSSTTLYTVTAPLYQSTSSRSTYIEFSQAGLTPSNLLTITQSANSYSTSVEWDGSSYQNAYCDTSYQYVDYKKVRDKYTWTYGPPTYGNYYNGDIRSQRIDGACGWVRAWTNWSNTGYYCGANGTGSYSCSGTFTQKYIEQVRHYCYPDGSGVTNTEYRAGSLYSSTLVSGQCGYVPESARWNADWGDDLYGPGGTISLKVTLNKALSSSRQFNIGWVVMRGSSQDSGTMNITVNANQLVGSKTENIGAYTSLVDFDPKSGTV